MAEYASEETLQELLDTAKAMNANLTKMVSILGKGKTSGGGEGDKAQGAAAKAMADLTSQTPKFLSLLGPAGKALSVLATVVEGLAGVFGMLAGMVSGLFNKISAVVGILGNFAMSATEGNMKLSDMVKVMGDLASQIPIVGGALGMLTDVMRFAIQRQEETLAIYRKLSQVGAGLGTSLEDLRSTSKSTGLTMDEYADAVQKHASQFVVFGGDMQRGTDAFTKNLQAVMGPGSQVSKAILGLGYEAKDAGELLSLYMAGQGSINKRGLQDSTAVAQGTKELAQQMTFLSEVTGQQREVIEKQLKDATAEANWQAFTAGLDPKAAANATKAVADAMAKFGPDGAKAVKLAIQTGITTPIDEAGAKMNIASKGQFQQYLENAKRIDKSSGAFLTGLDEGTNATAKGIDSMRKSLGPTNDIQVALGKGIINGQMQTLANQRSQYKSDKEYLDTVAKLREKTVTAGTGDAATLAQQQQNLRIFGNIVDSIMGTLLGPFLKPIMALTGSFEGLATKFATFITPYANDFAAWLEKWVDKFSKTDDFLQTFKDLFADIGKQMTPILKELWSWVADTMAPMLNKLIDKLFDYLRDHSWWMRRLLGSEKSTGQEAGMSADDKKAKAAEIKDLEKQIEEGKARREKVKQSGGGEFRQNVAYGKGQQQLDEAMLAKAKTELYGRQATTSKTPATGNVTGPGVDQSKLIRDWAYSVLSGQNSIDQVPASIKDRVKVVADNDESLKQQAYVYKQEMIRKAADAAAKNKQQATEKPAEATTQDELADNEAQQQIDAAKSQESSQDHAVTLNNNIDKLIKSNIRVAEATEKTASLIAANGNRFRA